MSRRVSFLLQVLFLFLCFSASAQTVMDSGYRVIAHIKSDGTIQDSNYRVVGHVKSDGTVQDDNYRVIGHIKKDGTVQDDSYRVIGHADGISLYWAAFFFFFL